MQDIQKYFQAAKDMRDKDQRRRISGLANLMRLADGPDSAIQRSADHLTKTYGVAVVRGERPDFIELTIVKPSNLKL